MRRRRPKMAVVPPPVVQRPMLLAGLATILKVAPPKKVGRQNPQKKEERHR